jgi:two-component system chemotaxis response regulator CheY
MKGRTILVVDDSGIIREQLSHTLRYHGFTVLTADNGGQGLTMAMSHPEIDLFIVDINMPNMNGLEMIEEIRLIPNHKDTPIFVLTTESSSEVANEGREAGATAWIVKPFKEEPLLAGINHVLGQQA